MRIWMMATAAVAAVGLSGCAVPAAVSIASYAADGASLVSTGRSVSDHGISILLQQDCALFRFVRGRAVCKPMKKDDLVYDVAFANRSYSYSDPDSPSLPGGVDIARTPPVPPTAEEIESIAQLQPKSGPAKAVEQEPPPAESTMVKAVPVAAPSPAPTVAGRAVVVPPQRIAMRTAPIDPSASGYHIVSGAFNRLEGAEQRRAHIRGQLARLGQAKVPVAITSLPDGSAARYVVLTGPVAEHRADSLVARLQLEKGETPWKMRSSQDKS